MARRDRLSAQEQLGSYCTYEGRWRAVRSRAAGYNQAAGYTQAVGSRAAGYNRAAGYTQAVCYTSADE